MTKSKKLFWGWVAVEVLVTGWIGVAIAMATEKPWARKLSKPTGDR